MKERIRAVIRWASYAFPPADRMLLLLIPVVVMDLIFAAVVQTVNEFSLANPVVWLYLLQKIAWDCALFMLLAALLRGAFKRPWAPVPFAVIFFVVQIVDMTVYHFAGVLFERQFLEFVSWDAMAGWIGPATILMLGLLGVAASGSGYLFFRYGGTLTLVHGARWILFGVLILLVNIPGRIDEGLRGTDEGTDAWYRREKVSAQLEYASRNSFLNFTKEVLGGTGGEYPEISDLTEFQGTLDTYGLPLGERSYPPLNLQPFRKVIVVLVEGLSLELLPPWNPALPGSAAPFYGSEEIRGRMFTDYRTTGTFTLRGVLTTMNSHPNANLLLSGRLQNSLPAAMRDAGYRTVFLRGASKYFPPENTLLKRMGFDEVIGKEDFRPELGKYTRGWGLYDRKLFDELIDLLKQGDDQIFVSLLGVDTHAPRGRALPYSDLEYPETPPQVASFGPGREMLRTVFRHDHDVRRLIGRLKSEGLWTEDLLLVLTGDHAFPYLDVLKQLGAYSGDPLGRIALAFLSPQPLPDFARDAPASQLDFAPTLAHLTGVRVQRGWWGESLFLAGRRNPPIGVSGDRMKIGGQPVDLRSPREGDEKQLVELYNTFYR